MTASRRKVPSTAANAKKPTRSVELKAERARFHIQLLATTLSIAPRRPNSTGLLPQRTHCYVRRPVDLATRRRA